MGTLEEKVNEAEAAWPWIEATAYGLREVLTWIVETVGELHGLVLLILAVPVLSVIGRWVKLLDNRSAIGDRTRLTFVNTVGDNRGKKAAASSENAAAIIRQCVLLVIVCGALVGVASKV